ncbi:MAG: orotidine-5'-phosphate decarboxylase [Myxococcota bacterium]|nr:orotidine-5'-phosphate decarboxylase [Myxococcota bacterium]
MALAVGDAVGMFKVGLELFVQAGPSAVAIGEEAGRPVFLDLKLHDIPETVDRAVARVAALGARMLTVHASGGPTMLRRAVERARKEGAGLEIAAVTVLTSFDDHDLVAVGLPRGVAEHVERLATMAWAEGVRTLVCSPHEAARLRAVLGPEATLVTPGVRPARTGSGSSAVRGDDQKRTMSAGEAIAAGASWVVVGRPIRDAADPCAMARDIAREIDEARGRPG